MTTNQEKSLNALRIGTLNSLAADCLINSVAHGFYADLEAVSRALESMAPDMPTEASSQGERDSYIGFCNMLRWFHSTAEQAAIARMHSELSEWLESIRQETRPIDEHCPEFHSHEIEAADVIIRVLDTCAAKHYRIGEAVIAKMNFNATRPYKHGKNS